MSGPELFRWIICSLLYWDVLAQSEESAAELVEKALGFLPELDGYNRDKYLRVMEKYRHRIPASLGERIPRESR